MLRFFRHIRKNLMEQNPSNGRTSKTRTYLLYAIGEIALVMIGILLALQVNNWNEERKAVAEEQVILTSLLEDLELAVSESKTMIVRDSIDVAVLKGFLLGEDLSHISKNQSAIDSLIILSIWGVGQSTPVIQTYNDIKSTGKTALIQNEEIRNKLAFIEINSNEIRTSLNDKVIVQQFQIDSIVAENLDMITFLKNRMQPLYSKAYKNDYAGILNNVSHKNTLVSKLILSEGLLNERIALNDLLIDLMDLIKLELKK